MGFGSTCLRSATDPIVVDYETTRQERCSVLAYSFQDIKKIQIDFPSCYKACISTISVYACVVDNFAIKYFHKCYNNFINMNQEMQLFKTGFRDFRDQATQTLDDDTEFDKKEKNQSLEENISLVQQLSEKNETINEMKSQLAIEKTKYSEMRDAYLRERKNMSEEIISLKTELRKFKDRYENLEKELKATQLELGQISVERDSKMNLRKKDEIFQNLFHSKPSTSSVLNMQENSSHFNSMSSINSDVQTNNAQLEDEKKMLPALPSPSGEQSAGACGESVVSNSCQDHEQSKELDAQNKNQDSNVRSNINVSPDTPPFPTEVHERRNAQPLSFISESSSSVNAHVYNAYKMLLISISVTLLYSDIIKLKQWANKKFSVDSNLNVLEIILQLDQKGSINASDLSQLRAFFESITRFDLIYLIDEFCNGDYDKLRKLISHHKSINNHGRGGNLNRVGSATVRLPHNDISRSPLRSNAVDQASNVEALERPSGTDESSGVSIVRNRERIENVRHSSVASTSVAAMSGNRFSTHENSENVLDAAVNNTRGNQDAEKRLSTIAAPVTAKEISGKKMSDSKQYSFQRRPKSAGESSSHPSQSHRDYYFHGKKSGNKQDIWLCSHYKRRCLVKFECCDKYWPCHRCHNNESSCGQKKLKSRDTTMIKCVECGEEQEFGQFCVSCNTQFANFYCGQCKHLTGHDDHPYHCDKCGICRIHGDRSFHCDVCGICLDVQLRGNHKCRAGSAHDECGICLEDAFTGCQILPCSHKVHKECANRMIRNGITRCPICRESFAHKLERRPVGRRKR